MRGSQAGLVLGTTGAATTFVCAELVAEPRLTYRAFSRHRGQPPGRYRRLARAA